MDVRLRLIRERQWLLWGSGGICGLLWQCGVVKNPPAKQETWVRSLGREDPLEKEIATNSGTVNWVSKELNTTERVNNNSNRPYPLI